MRQTAPVERGVESSFGYMETQGNSWPESPELLTYLPLPLSNHRKPELDTEQACLASWFRSYNFLNSLAYFFATRFLFVPVNWLAPANLLSLTSHISVETAVRWGVARTSRSIRLSEDPCQACSSGFQPIHESPILALNQQTELRRHSIWRQAPT